MDGLERALPDLLRQASSVLAREMARVPLAVRQPGLEPAAAQGAAAGDHDAVASIPAAAAAQSLLAARCPVTGVGVTPAGAPGDLRRQAHELVASLLGLLGPGVGAWGSTTSPYSAAPVGAPSSAAAGGEHVCPVTLAAMPSAPFDKDKLRQQAHQLIETLLVTFNEATGEKGLPTEDQVPLLRCAAPVPAGGTGRATLRVANEEATPSRVSLYSTDFVADSGHQIPSLRVSVSPRQATLPAGGEGAFEIAIAVPSQTPPGIYSALIQAMGNKYVKAVLTMQVT